MIKVLQLGITDNLGGIETFMINYYRNIDKSKVLFDFVNIYPNDLCFQNEIEQNGGKVYKLPSYYRHPVKYLKQLIKLINDNSYDIIHCNMNSAAMLYPLIGSKISNAKIVICHAHNASSDKGMFKSLLHNINKHFIPLFANYYFSCSDKAAEWFFGKKNVKKNNYYTINNAIDIDRFKFNESERINKRKELNINNSTFVIGHVGRFVKQKNHSFIIDVFNEVHKKNKDSVLLLVGQGPLKEEVEQKVKTLGLSDAVLFLGKRNDVYSIYNVMDCFILPSLYEGLPLVGVEAQTNGLKCIFSNKITKSIIIGSNSIMLPIDTTKDYVEELINSNYDRKNIDNNPYDIKKCSKEIVSIYEKMLKEE